MRIPRQVYDRIAELWIGGTIVGFSVDSAGGDRWVLTMHYTSDVRPDRPDELYWVETTILKSRDRHALVEMRNALEGEYLGLD